MDCRGVGVGSGGVGVDGRRGGVVIRGAGLDSEGIQVVIRVGSVVTLFCEIYSIVNSKWVASSAFCCITHSTNANFLQDVPH